MTETTYRIQTNGVAWQTTDSEEAERLTRNGARVTAVTNSYE